MGPARSSGVSTTLACARLLNHRWWRTLVDTDEMIVGVTPIKEQR